MRARAGKGTAQPAGSEHAPGRAVRTSRLARLGRSARPAPAATTPPATDAQPESATDAQAEPATGAQAEPATGAETVPHAPAFPKSPAHPKAPAFSAARALPDARALPEARALPNTPVAMLRPWRLDDAAALQAAFITSGDLAAQLGAIELSTITRCQNFITDNLASATVTRQNFAISVDGVAVGNVGIGSMEHRHGTGWVYYWVSAETRGRGLATLALVSIAEWAFTEQGLHRLELGHRTNNPASCRVAAKAGFTFEGVERQKLKYGSERFDVETHARLRTDAPPPVRPLPTVTF